MKSGCKQEDLNKKYASSTSESAWGAGPSVGANQYVASEHQQKHLNSIQKGVPVEKSDEAITQTHKSISFQHSIRPCPFTFLTAVKRKLAINAHQPTCKKVYEPKNFEGAAQDKMDFVKPLKVPDLKITPKADYSSQESLLSTEELSRRIETVQKDDLAKINDRATRKLEFSSSSAASILNYDNIEPLKVPDLSISKNKEYLKSSSKEKENRSKRLRRETGGVLKSKDELQDFKWSKGRHISRKEIADSIINKRLKNDRVSSHISKDSDIILKKPKIKNSASSCHKKDEEKRHRFSSIPISKAKKDRSLEHRNRTSSSDSIYLTDKGTRLHDKILIREGYKAMISEINDLKGKDDKQMTNSSKHSEDQKYKLHLENRNQKLSSKSNSMKPIELLSRDQNKRISDKQKSSNKTDIKHSSEISEDVTTAATSVTNYSKSQNIASEIPTTVSPKTNTIDRTAQSNSNRNFEQLQNSNSHSGSSNQVMSSVIETNLSSDNSLSEKLMDPLKISFREDNYSNQPDFANLVTPDVNLMIRSRRRKIFQNREGDISQLMQSPMKTSSQVDGVRTLQLKSEVDSQDSVFDTLRQTKDTERTRATNDELKKYSSPVSNDSKNIDFKRTESEISELRSDEKNKIQKPLVKGVEVQTQTANDIATQTEITLRKRSNNTILGYSRVSIGSHDLSNFSLESEDKYRGMDRLEDISFPGKMRTMSEISLHETNSSIKTETGTEISISTRDVTCSFNKYLDLEMAQLIRDEKQRYDKIEMLFKSREKTLNDRTKKLVKLEEQKRALRDTGQDSRISSVKKKQRALLLKLQHEKEEMNRLKELHKIASQERKLMLQKQRDMFNPDMSTKNILHKLKRSADNQSPRRLSGPMKGYDIRSNSSMSSLIDSDKSQLDRSQLDLKLNLSDVASQKNEHFSSKLEFSSSKQTFGDGKNRNEKLSSVEIVKQLNETAAGKSNYELKSRKFEDRMPKPDSPKFKPSKHDSDAIMKHASTSTSALKNGNAADFSQDDDEKSIPEYIKSESDVLMEEFTQIWKSQFPDLPVESFEASDSLEMLKEMQKFSPRRLDKDSLKRLQQQLDAIDSKNGKRKGGKIQKVRTSESLSKSEESHYAEESNARHRLKRSKVENEQQSDDNYQNSMLEELDFNESQSSLQALLKHSTLLKERNQQLLQEIANERNNAENSESPLSQKDEEENPRIGGNISARSQLSLTISHQSSNDSDRSYSRSVVIRSQQDHHESTTGLKKFKKLEQILRAREATLVSRRNCVEDWIAWHARLRDEEDRVARMEQAAYKLVSATAKALSHNDTTVSSDTSDVEGRIELLTQKLADRRLEMARLKKEARKQAKQRLRALEANLMNQIKKYDATIRDMRKKIDARKSLSKDNEKLAIESKSIADFKVPEIPMKRIQEIYKNSDLLRSKSEPDAISDKSTPKDDWTKNEKMPSNESERSTLKSKTPSESKPTSSLQTVYDEEIESSDHSPMHSNRSKSNSEEVATLKNVVVEIQDLKRPSSQSSNISEEIPSEAYSIKSLTEQILTERISEALSTQSLPEKIEGSIKVSKGDSVEVPSNIEEELMPVTDDTSLIFSRKLDNLQLHNKELNDDLHNLENDLKELTEIMSNLSKKSDDKSSRSMELLQDSKRNSSGDVIVEELLPSETNVESSDIDKDLQDRVKKILSDVVPETDDLITSIEELDPKGGRVTDSEKSLDHSNKSAELEEIPGRLSSSTFIEKDDSLSSADYHKSGASSVSDALSSTADENKENISPNLSQKSSQRVYIDHVVEAGESHIEISVDDTQHSSHILENLRTEAAFSKRTDELSTDQEEPLSKINENDVAEGLLTENSGLKDDDIPLVLRLSTNLDGESILKNDGNLKSEVRLNESITSTAIDESIKETEKTENSIINKSESDHDWVLSDSFDIQRIEDSDRLLNKVSITEKSTDPKSSVKDVQRQSEDRNGSSDMEDSNLFIPKGESTNIQDTFVLHLDDSSEAQIGIRSDEFNDILEIIERETKNDDDQRPEPAILSVSQNIPKQEVLTCSPLGYGVSGAGKTADEVSDSIEEEIEDKNSGSVSEDLINDESMSNNESDLPQIEIGVRIEVVNDDGESRTESELGSPMKARLAEIVEASAEDRGSSDGEQMDNLVEFAEGKLDVVEKFTPTKVESDGSVIPQGKPKTQVEIFLDRTFDMIKGPEYEDISEESIEVSEILDKDSSQQNNRKVSKIPERYVIKSKSDEVLRILDEISSKSSNRSDHSNKDAECENNLSPVRNTSPVASISPPQKSNDLESINVELSIELEQDLLEKVKKNDFRKSPADGAEDVQEKQDDSPKVVSDSSEAGVSEIDTDSPRENENSRLDVDVLDDDLLSGNSMLTQTQDSEAKTEFRTTPMGIASEKDIEAMIHKLKASLEQPGLEVAKLEAKLLQIENLQIELEIKKLEAEEVSYYVREIPNKPPPPYTPPGVVRHSGAHGSPSPPPAVIPVNVDELTAFTDKATALIFEAKESGVDVLSLEAPDGICELAKDNNNTKNGKEDILKKERRVYNGFLFDLCKELVAELYKTEHEKPGPSWTKPNIKTKPVVKLPRGMNELSEYVAKEVATLFGFKTKLQRENMVMRWSRKRRDRVDELLAKEAQAEEKEWTKFHHDELTVKNELTTAILDSLVSETVSCVKSVYTKKRRLVDVAV
ncbi:hypothetical protein QAD02_004347 [Eretmocerus hayati]|uniref:Uncharacterized protein n=1 Tax=Eretmocerus hayati TaxID=131215 RepID=A0ACC2NPM0_9HYME|nr:hypothetical protein QAD02_004347 [Eretmocerus hayati]